MCTFLPRHSIYRGAKVVRLRRPWRQQKHPWQACRHQWRTWDRHPSQGGCADAHRGEFFDAWTPRRCLRDLMGRQMLPLLLVVAVAVLLVHLAGCQDQARTLKAATACQRQTRRGSPTARTRRLQRSTSSHPMPPSVGHPAPQPPPWGQQRQLMEWRRAVRDWLRVSSRRVRGQQWTRRAAAQPARVAHGRCRHQRKRMRMQRRTQVLTRRRAGEAAQRTAPVAVQGTATRTRRTQRRRCPQGTPSPPPDGLHSQTPIPTPTRRRQRWHLRCC